MGLHTGQELGADEEMAWRMLAHYVARSTGQGQMNDLHRLLLTGQEGHNARVLAPRCKQGIV